MKHIKGGVIRSRVDHRDYQAEAIFHMERIAGAPSSQYAKKIIPREYFCFDEGADPSKLEIGGNEVYNQGQSFRCVAYSLCTIREKQVYNEMIASNNPNYNSETNNGNFAGSGNIDINPHRLYTPTTEFSNAAESASGRTPWADSINSMNDTNSTGGGGGSNNDRRPMKCTFSKDYIYDLRANRFTDGMSGADGMQIVSTYGCINEKDYEKYLNLYNSVAEFERQIRQLEQYGGAGANGSGGDQITHLHTQVHDYQNQINELIIRFKRSGPGDVYARVSTINGLKDSLIHNGPCLIILPFYGQTDRIDFWTPPMNNKVDEMGHCCTVVGYSDDQNAFFVRNTWSSKWGIGGHFWLDYNILKIAWEIWTIFPKGTEHLLYHKRRIKNAMYPNLLAGAGTHVGVGTGVGTGVGADATRKNKTKASLNKNKSHIKTKDEKENKKCEDDDSSDDESCSDSNGSNSDDIVISSKEVRKIGKILSSKIPQILEVFKSVCK